jgi:hypothetical protein
MYNNVLRKQRPPPVLVNRYNIDLMNDPPVIVESIRKLSFAEQQSSFKKPSKFPSVTNETPRAPPPSPCPPHLLVESKHNIDKYFKEQVTTSLNADLVQICSTNHEHCTFNKKHLVGYNISKINSHLTIHLKNSSIQMKIKDYESWANAVALLNSFIKTKKTHCFTFWDCTKANTVNIPEHNIEG